MEGSWIAKVGFWASIVILLALSLLPSGVAPSLPGDKLQHFLGFFVVGVLGFGWVAKRKATMVTFLVLLGGMIELLQATPLIGRDAEILDWLADLAGIAVALAVVGGARFVAKSEVPPL